MTRSLERITLLVPLLIVSGITIVAAVATVAVVRLHATPPAQALADRVASSEKTSVDRKATSGPTTLGADTHHAMPSLLPIGIVAASAIAASLLAAIVATLLVRRSILRIVDSLENGSPLNATGALAMLDASLNRLFDRMSANDVALRRRTLELESANKELEAFTFSASHDLRAPLASIDGFAQMLIDECDAQLDEMGRDCVHWIRDACAQMQELVDGLLQMSHFSRAEIEREEVDLSQLAHSVADALRQREPNRNVDIRIRDGIVANGDRRLLRAVIENLMSNAWKFTRKHPHATIEFGVTHRNGRAAIFMRDDGAGFDPGYADKMFRAFQRLHTRQEFEGTGIGLATVERILHRHGGRIWAEGEIEKGATFFFVIPSGSEAPAAGEARKEDFVAPAEVPGVPTTLGMTASGS